MKQHDATSYGAIMKAGYYGQIFLPVDFLYGVSSTTMKDVEDVILQKAQELDLQVFVEDSIDPLGKRISWQPIRGQ